MTMSTVSDTTMVDPKTLEVASPFKDVFPICKPVQQAIEMSMEEDGFDEAHPIIVWLERNCVLDGHTRLASAINIGLVSVPVVYKSYENEDDAIEYAINCQKNRRNLSDSDIWRYVQALDRRKPKGGEGSERGNQYKSGKPSHDGSPKRGNLSAANTAEIIGTNVTKVERVRLLMNRASEEIKDRLAGNGTPITINGAYKLVREEEDRKRREKPTKPQSLQNILLPTVSGDATPTVTQATSLPARELDKQVYDWISPKLAEIKAGLVALVGPPNLARVPPFYKAVWDLINSPSPTTWPECSRCKGQIGATCTKCRGSKYQMPS